MKRYLSSLRLHLFNIRQYVFDPLNKGEKASRLLDYLKWHIGYKYNGKKWIVTYENGLKSVVHPYPDHDAGELDIWTKNNDYHETLFIRSLLQKGDRIYDIGCNVGNRTWVLADIISGALLIDASEEAIVRTRENRDLNNLPAEAYEVSMTAMGREVGEVKFSNLGGASTLNKIVSDNDTNAMTNTRTVPMTTIDVVAKARDWLPVFIKIDAEGHDFEVLKGGTETLKSGRVKCVKFERFKTIDLEEVAAFWSSLGWVIFTLDDKGRPTQDARKVEASANIFAMTESEYSKLPQ